MCPLQKNSKDLLSKKFNSISGISVFSPAHNEEANIAEYDAVIGVESKGKTVS